jgi:hypothetical protein
MRQTQPHLGYPGQWLVYHVAAWWGLLAAVAGIWLYNTAERAHDPTGWAPLPVDHYVVIFAVTITLVIYTGSRWRQAAHSSVH